MGDIFRRASIGEDLVIPAELYNGLLEMYKDWLRKRASARSPSAGTVRPGKVMFQNDSGSALDIHSIVAIGQGNPLK